MTVLCNHCAPEWKYVAYAWPHAVDTSDIAKMKYTDEGQLAYADYEGPDVLIVNHYEGAFCHYVPVAVLAKDYFNHAVRKSDLFEK